MMMSLERSKHEAGLGIAGYADAPVYYITTRITCIT
jgi:hypothetical protein